MASDDIKFRVGFETDTSGLQKLKSSLSEIHDMTVGQYMDINKGMNLKQAQTELLEVKRAARDVEMALKNSFNSDLGTTNVVKFNQELQKININGVAEKFNKLGATGKNAFRDLTTHILTTNLQLRETHKFLDNVATTIGNTLKWNVASSLINSFTGSIQRAYTYVKDLDESLTNIRIVSGQSAEQMAKFAEQANNAAQAMGTTTTRYTDAALIYYQQGLSDEEVIKRTNTTMQMANVLGESAEKVSSYMTAIWNNFDDGSKSLEYYGDVVTALGASTAASSEEIAQGIEKFASVAETAGLSYEYATASLATVVAATRQSADTVGTAFKTIFARIQGLNLGETLDDGTTLNKYSEALSKVGISIKEQNGQLKDMDTILDEMGSKWETLNKDQQLALAQTVAGTRQYNQLVALMNNWEDVQKNINTAKNAGGTLDEQQEIYMESMEAHLNSFKAAKEDLQDSFFDSDSFKDLIDVFTKLTKGISNFVDGIGGGGTALLGLGSIATNVFSKHISQGIMTTITNLQSLKYNFDKTLAEKQIAEQFGQVPDEAVKKLIEMKEIAFSYRDIMSEAQEKELNGLIEERAELEKSKTVWDEKVEKAYEYAKAAHVVTNNTRQSDPGYHGSVRGISSFSELNGDTEDVNDAIKNNLKNVSEAADEASERMKKYKIVLQSFAKIHAGTVEKIKVSGKEIGKTDVAKTAADQYDKLKQEVQEYSKSMGLTAEQQEKLNKAINSANGYHTEDKEEALRHLLAAYEEVVNEVKEDAEETSRVIDGLTKNTSKTIQDDIDENEKHINKFRKNLDMQGAVQGFTQLLSGIGQVAAGLRSLSNIKNVINDENLSTGEKFLQIMSSISMGIPMLISGVSSMKGAFAKLGKSLTGLTSETLKQAAANGKLATTLWAALGPILAVVAAIAVLTAGIYLLVKAYNKDADAAKEATKNAETLKNAYNELKTAADDLKESISDYTDAKKELYQLKKGTEEYKEALEKANEQAKHLIETYKLFGQYTTDEDGLIVFKEGVLEDVLNQKQAAVVEAEARMNAANIVANNANEKSNKTNFRRRELNEEYLVKIAEGVAAGAAAGLAAGALPGAVVGGIIGGGVTTFTADKTIESKVNEISSAMQEILENNKGIELSDSDLIEQLNGYGDAVKNNTDLIIKNRDAFETLAKSAIDAKEANDYYTKNIIKNAVQEKYGDKIVEYATDENGNVDEGLASQLEETTAAVLQRNGDSLDFSGVNELGSWASKYLNTNNGLRSVLKNGGYEDYANEFNGYVNDEDVARLYAKKVLGYSDKEVSQMKYVSDKNGRGTLTDASGEIKYVNNLLDADMRKDIYRQAQMDAIRDKYKDQLAGIVLESVNQASKASYNGIDFGNALLSNLQGDDRSKVNLTSILNQIKPKDVKNLKEMSGKDLIDALGLSDKDIENLGFTNAEIFQKAFTTGLSDYDASAYWQNEFEVATNNAGEIGDALSALSADKLTKKQLEEMNETLSSLENKYPELAKIQEQGGHEYLALLRQIQEQEEENARVAAEENKKALLENAENTQKEIDDLREGLKDAKDNTEREEINLKIQAKTELLEKQLEEIQEADYSIKMSIEADFKSDIQNAFGLAKEFENLQSYIKEDFKITAEEAQEFIEAGYGAMLQNAQASSDGLIQLDDEVVNAYIDGQQAKLEADKEEKIAELENQKAVLQSQLQTLQAKQTALSEASKATTRQGKQAALANAMIEEAKYQAKLQELNGEVTAQDEANNLTADGAAELYNTLSSMYTTDSQNEQDATDSSDKAAAQHGKNVVAYYNKMQEAVANYRKAIESGDINLVEWDLGNGGIDKNAPNTQAVTNTYDDQAKEIPSAIKDLTETLDGEALDQVIDQMSKDTEREIQLINDQIGQVDAAIAALNSSSSALDDYQANRGKKSGSGSEKDPDEMESFKQDQDIFHDADTELKKYTTDLNRLQKQQKKLSGKELIDNLDDQLSLLEKQRDVYNEKVKLAREEAKQIRDGLAGKGITFNDDGTISNYRAALQAREDYINSLIQQYNGMSKDEQSKFKNVIETAKKEYTEFKKEMDNYNKYINETIPGLEDQITEALDKEIEIKIAQVETKVKVRLDLTEAEKEWNEFNRSIVQGLFREDQEGYLTSLAQETLSNIGSYYNSDNTGQLQINTEYVDSILKELQKIDNGEHSSIYSAYDEISGTWVDNKEKALEDLKTYYQQLMKDLKQLQDYAKEVDEAFLKSIDNVNTAFEQRSKVFEFYNKQIEHDLKMTQLLFGEKAYDKIGEQQEKQIANLTKQKEALKEQTSYWKDLMDAARAAGDDEAYKKYLEKWQSSVESLNSMVEQLAEKITEKYANTINGILDEFDKKLTDGLGLEYTKEEWDLINKNADNYLDTVNQAYKIQELQNKWQKAINDTDSTTAQRKLNKLMNEQMKMLREKDKLSQYDIDRANKEYELALKQIALEEAQQNKSTMRLRRDANGNYSYYFSADQDSIAQAQQDLAAAQNDLYNFDKEKYRENLDGMYSIITEYREKVAQVYMDYANDEEGRTKALTLLQEQYGEKINFLTDQNATIRTNLQNSTVTAFEGLYGTEVQNFKNMSAEEMRIFMEETIPGWDGGVQHMIDKFSKGEDSFESLSKETFNQLDSAAKDHKENLDAIKQETDAITTSVEKEQQTLETESQKALTAAEAERQKVSEVRTQVQGLINDYRNAKDAAINAANAAHAYWAAAKGEGLDIPEETYTATPYIPAENGTYNYDFTSETVEDLPATENDKARGNNKGTSKKEEDKTRKVGTISQQEAEAEGLRLIQEANNKMIRGENNWAYYEDGGLNNWGQQIWVIYDKNKKYIDFTFSEPINLEKLDTGGYTGEWGSEGRLALLHQKELVLNAHDTDNMLNMVNIMRKLTSSFSDNVLNRAYTMMESIGANLISFREMASADSLEQNVHIEATFPNVVESREIENALNNLVNRASQYANKIRR